MTDWPKPNFALLNDWNDPTTPKPATKGNLRPWDTHESDRLINPYIGEIWQESYNAHLILDLLDVPAVDDPYSGDIDARVSVLAQEFCNLGERLDRIEGWHSLETGEHGTVGTLCDECGNHWPCDTRKMADGTWTEADELDFS